MEGPAAASIVCEPDQAAVTIRIQIGGMQLTANPEVTKPLGSVLNRLQSKLQKAHKKSKTPAPVMALEHSNGEPLDLTIPVGDLMDCVLVLGELRVDLRGGGVPAQCARDRRDRHHRQRNLPRSWDVT